MPVETIIVGFPRRAAEVTLDAVNAQVDAQDELERGGVDVGDQAQAFHDAAALLTGALEGPGATTWELNRVQFPRLLAEIMAIGLTDEQIEGLATSMDLHRVDVYDLFDRADDEWQAIKEMWLPKS